MPKVSRFSKFVVLLAVGVVIFASGCSGCTDEVGGGVGAQCEGDSDCANGLSCVDGTCQGDENQQLGPDAGVDVEDDADVSIPDEDTGDTGGDPDAGDPDADEPDVGPECDNATTCAAEGVECGTIADGCGGTLFCGSCGPGENCGTGEDRGLCLQSECVVEVTCEDAGIECGVTADGCGGTLACGSCGDGEICSAGVCYPGDCEPLGCEDHTPGECGILPDGCGGVVNCGGCGSGYTCEAGECEEIDCVPMECSDHNPGDCGPLPDGCGGTLDCGTCSGNQVCGTGTDRGACVDPECVPLTCADYPNANCGVLSDGCGGTTANCGTCQAPEICGGGALPNVCGADPADGCDGLCQDQAVCPAGEATTLTGTVVTPNEELPIPNAVVYVPNVDLADLPPIETGTVCQQCEDEELGSPLVGTISDYDGSFELRHVPAGVEFPLVIKVGDWRRVVMVPAQSACGTYQLDTESTRLPRFHQEGNVHDNIPHIAVSTGAVDAMECLFYQIGVDESEFTRHTENGRIHLYRANGGLPDSQLSSICSGGSCNASWCTDQAWDSICDGATNSQLLQANLSDNLYGDQAVLDGYDMVVMSCEAFDRTSLRGAAELERIRNYVDGGGRLFASHYAYDWLHQTTDLQDTATWGGSEGFNNYSLGFVDTSFAGGMTFYDWLQLVDADYGPLGPGGEPQIEITDPRTYVQSVNDSLATRWVYNVAGVSGHVSPSAVQQYTFDTPVYAGAGQQCGQVAYSAFHVAGVSTGHGPTFPSYCGGALTPQEKVLVYMLFDLAACVTDEGEPPAPECTPITCDDVDVECGVVADGCGGVTDNCGTCPDGTACGAGGVPNMCGGACAPMTCEEYGADCGIIDDGCGGTVDCGDCPGGEICGAGGTPNICGCDELSCDDHGAQCGEVSDGCGGTLDCGDCPGDQVCGGGGVPNICSGDCDPLSCEDHGVECGPVDDGCGGFLDCGDCPDPEFCGGGGVPNMCGCTPLTCEDHGAGCGEVSDGCGGTVDCGECPGIEECVDFQCVVPECRAVNEPCNLHEQCCSGVCTGSSSEEGVCISN